MSISICSITHNLFFHSWSFVSQCDQLRSASSAPYSHSPIPSTPSYTSTGNLSHKKKVVLGGASGGGEVSLKEEIFRGLWIWNEVMMHNSLCCCCVCVRFCCCWTETQIGRWRGWCQTNQEIQTLDGQHWKRFNSLWPLYQNFNHDPTHTSGCIWLDSFFLSLIAYCACEFVYSFFSRFLRSTCSARCDHRVLTVWVKRLHWLSRFAFISSITIRLSISWDHEFIQQLIVQLAKSKFTLMDKISCKSLYHDNHACVLTSNHT